MVASWPHPRAWAAAAAAAALATLLGGCGDGDAGLRGAGDPDIIEDQGGDENTTATTAFVTTRVTTTRVVTTTPEPRYPEWSWEETWELPRSSEDDARFLIQSTFGPTSSSLAALSGTPYIDWLTAQMALPAGEHRVHYRQRANPRLSGDRFTAAPRSPCEKHSRWTTFALQLGDVGKKLEKTADGRILINGVLRTEIHADYTGNGLQAPASCSDEWSQTCAAASWRCRNNPNWVKNQFCQQTCHHAGFGYEGLDCSAGWPALAAGEYTICGVQEGVGEWVFLTSTTCENPVYSQSVANGGTPLPNPGIYLASPPADSGLTLITNADLPSGVALLQDAQAAGCPLETLSVLRSGSALYWHDARVALLHNTPEKPAMAAGQKVCPAVPKHPLNEKDCKVMEACVPLSSYRGEIVLTQENIKAFMTITGLYVYSIAGLVPTASPCGGVRSRWKLCTSDCGSSMVAAEHQADIPELLREASEEGDVRDITSATCVKANVVAGAYIEVDGLKFRNIHPTEGDVYDFTEWVGRHPGGPAYIKKQEWVDAGEIVFAHPTMMGRWEGTSTQRYLHLLGKKGSTIRFEDLPLNMQTAALAAQFSAQPTEAGWLACGSQGEVGNQPELGHGATFFTFYADGNRNELDVMLDADYSRMPVQKETKGNIWLNKAMSGEDQLRQRAAWALSQTFVVAQQGPDLDVLTEMWVNYYDIFVRNAFGNFRDIMREVTYSPVMGDYLTFAKSSAYDYNKFHPDENYAREIMQLFTIGLWKLEDDGRRIWDAQGREVPTYSNDHITNFARVMTGFLEQPTRANLEVSRVRNMIDPMRMDPKRHDVYPKIDLGDGHLGDGYPLCHELPKGSFLKKGAVYEFIGCSHDELEVLVLDASSKLKAALDGGDSAACPGSFSAVTVTLPADVECVGGECHVEVPEVIQVGTGYFRYLPPICVHLFFFHGQVTREEGRRWTWSTVARCDNPLTRVAGTWCCKGCRDNAWSGWGRTCPEQRAAVSASSWAANCNQKENWVNARLCELTCHNSGLGYNLSDCSAGEYAESWRCAYPAAYVTFGEAQAQCQAAGGLSVCGDSKTLKPLDEVAGAPCNYSEHRLWTAEECSPKVRVYGDGTVASQRDSKTMVNFFRVRWALDVQPAVGACAEHGCEETANGDACECDTSLASGPVLETKPTTVEDVEAALPFLKVGAYPSQAAGAASSCGAECLVYWSPAEPTESVIEFKGRLYKNVWHLVSVGNGLAKFRNPPAFNLAERPDERQALAEVEAFLDHLFEHPNTPVYVASRLIQRFVTSTPSAAYVRNVSKAFQSGRFFGRTFSGRRGDLAATIAAILLDPEARTAADVPTAGALREPILKLVHFLRSMEYQDKQGPDGRPLTTTNLVSRLGQWPYNSPTVFNFYHFDYQPNGFEQGVYAPEFEIFTTPLVISFLNGVMHLIDNGLSQCGDGFGRDGPPCPQGALAWAPASADAAAAVDELGLLLTGGRLNASRAAVEAAFSAGADAKAKVRAAQQAMIMSPEFNTLGTSHDAGERVIAPTSTPPAPPDYKALVLLFLHGGADTFNLVVPSNANCKLYDEYLSVRQDVALRSHELLEFTTSGQACSKFAVHGKLPFLHSLYSNDGKAAFLANIGSLAEPTTKEAYLSGRAQRCAGLFSHSDQQTAAMTLECQTQGASPKGFGGRMADVLNKAGLATTSFSIAGAKTFAEGFNTTIEIVDGRNGATRFNVYEDVKGTVDKLVGKRHSNVYCEEYTSQLKHALDSSERLATLLEASDVQAIDGFPDTGLGMQLHQAARLIKTRAERRAARDLFFVELTGFDTHTDDGSILEAKFAEINDALQAFVGELKTQGIFDAVTLVTASDFGRTLTSNGAGTDHAWAGNHFIVGGSVNGGKMYNSYPQSLLEGNQQDLGKGRLIPSYPWESVFVPVAEWMGVRQDDLQYVFPNRGRFNATQLIARASLFG